MSTHATAETASYRVRMRRDIGKKVDTFAPDGSVNGMRTQPDGKEVADIIVEVNLAALARRLGVRDMKNKSGKCKYLFGEVTVRAINKTKEA